MGIIIPTYHVDERRLVISLNKKIPRGTPLRVWFFGQQGHDNIETVRAWLERVAAFKALLPRRKNEATRRAAEEQEDDGNQEGEDGQDPDPPPEPDPEAAARLNDARQARSGLRRTQGSGKVDVIQKKERRPATRASAF